MKRHGTTTLPYGLSRLLHCPLARFEERYRLTWRLLCADPVEVLVAVRVVRESALVEPRLDFCFERQVVALQRAFLSLSILGLAD